MYLEHVKHGDYDDGCQRSFGNKFESGRQQATCQKHQSTRNHTAHRCLDTGRVVDGGTSKTSGHGHRSHKTAEYVAQTER